MVPAQFSVMTQFMLLFLSLLVTASAKVAKRETRYRLIPGSIQAGQGQAVIITYEYFNPKTNPDFMKVYRSMAKFTEDQYGVNYISEAIYERVLNIDGFVAVAYSIPAKDCDEIYEFLSVLKMENPNLIQSAIVQC
uniref:Secreted protein n=1 Tax=Haemonchus contortus TaxID=6289 RepID=A0A7I4YEH8_HAECO